MRKRKYFIECAIAIVLLAGQGMAVASNVVVIPLGGGSGNAEAGDVLKGKTFSNSAKDGIGGTRPPAPVAKTGQSKRFVLGDDGGLEPGVVWPSTRFESGPTRIGAGNTDYLTGLIWVRSPHTDELDWKEAVQYCSSLSTGSGILRFKDWRLPTLKELQSLLDLGESAPALPADHPFTLGSIRDNDFWSSTSFHFATTYAWLVSLLTGDTVVEDKNTSLRNHAWCVRGPYF